MDEYALQIHLQNEDVFKSLFERDAILISGTKVFRGIGEIYSVFLKGLICEKYSSIRLVKEDLEIRNLDVDNAVVVFHYHTECILKGSGEEHSVSGVETQLVHKSGVSWKIAHIHYSMK